MIQLGNRRALGEKDLYKVASEDESERLGLTLGRYSYWNDKRNFKCLYLYPREWEKLVEKSKQSNKDERPSFTRALLGTFGSKTLFPTFLLLVEECIVKYNN